VELRGPLERQFSVTVVVQSAYASIQLSCGLLLRRKCSGNLSGRSWFGKWNLKNTRKTGTVFFPRKLAGRRAGRDCHFVFARGRLVTPTEKAQPRQAHSAHFAPSNAACHRRGTVPQKRKRSGPWFKMMRGQWTLKPTRRCGRTAIFLLAMDGGARNHQGGADRTWPKAVAQVWAQ